MQEGRWMGKPEEKVLAEHKLFLDFILSQLSLVFFSVNFQ